MHLACMHMAVRGCSQTVLTWLLLRVTCPALALTIPGLTGQTCHQYLRSIIPIPCRMYRILVHLAGGSLLMEVCKSCSPMLSLYPQPLGAHI
jgi:hypothetical protein